MVPAALHSRQRHLPVRRGLWRGCYHLHLTVVGALTTIALAVLDLLLTVFPDAGTERFTPSLAEDQEQAWANPRDAPL